VWVCEGVGEGEAVGGRVGWKEYPHPHPQVSVDITATIQQIVVIDGKLTVGLYIYFTSK
jgi:hypothetical protein